jgi:hypothetical protein
LTWITGATVPYARFLASTGKYLFYGYNDAVGALYISSDDGMSWDYAGGPDQSFHRADAAIVSGPNVVVGTDITGTWYRPLSEIIDALGVSKTASPNDPLRLSPNPTEGIIAVHAANIEHITIENLLGERVLEVANPRASEFTLDLSKLPAGIYFARFEMAGGEVVMRKVVKE